MANPPESISPSELWLALTALPRPYRTVDFPRKDPVTGEPLGKLAMVVLTQEEQMVAAAEAERTTRRLLKEAPKSDEARRGYDDLYGNASAVELLFRCCRKEDLSGPLFPSTADIRKHLSVDEVGALVSAYLHVQAEIGPIIASMDDAEMEAWIARLAEGGSTIPLAFISPEAVNRLIITMASRLYALSTATSSPGLQPEENPSDSENEPSQPEQATP